VNVIKPNVNSSKTENLNKNFIQDESKVISVKKPKTQEKMKKISKNENENRPSYHLKIPKTPGLNTKISMKSKQLKIVMNKNSKKKGPQRNIIEYNHDHLSVCENRKLVKIIEKTEKIDIKKLQKNNQFICLSDNVYRLNKWKKKKLKFLIITQKYMYIITPPHEKKRILKLSEILQIKSRGNKDNFICFITDNKNDEMLEIFKKNELLLFMMQLIRKERLNILIQSNVKSFVMLNTSNKNVIIDPIKLQKYKPIYNNVFNYASRMNKLMNLYVWKDGVFASKNYHKKVVLVTDMGLLIFSKVQWDLERFVPFGGKLC
jgi:hypothetical protein